MKIAMLYGPRDLRIETQELDSANLEPDQVWVETQLTGFKIGTDRGNYEGAEHVPGAPGYPRPVGDSNLGIVRGVGSAVEAFAVGDQVVSMAWHQSEYVFRENARMVKVPPQTDPEDAVFSNLYALSAHCYLKAHFSPGETVAVVGLGLLGLGAVGLGLCFGARVVGLGNSEVRLDMARQAGADAAYLSDDAALAEKLDEFTGGRGVDLVILTANPWSAWQTAMEVVRPDGRVSVVSLPGRGETPLEFNPVDMKWFYAKGISLIAVNGEHSQFYPGPDERCWGEKRWDYVLELMRNGRLSPKRLVTHRLHYSEMVQAYEMAYHREKNMLNVVFNWKDHT